MFFEYPAGYVDDVMGWDFGGSCADAACTRCTPGPDPTDMTGWGTHAAAVIAAQPEVASGTAGIAPGVRVMALKVADCRSGTQLGDWAVQEELGSTAGSSSSSSERQLQGHGAAHPVLLASAAVQAFDYAVLNGAHIVLAAWRAGSILDAASSDSTSADAAGSADNATASTAASEQDIDCLLGSADVTSAAPNSSSACLAAVQRLLFLDALQPLEQAGVLVVTMHPDDNDTSSSSTSAAASDTSAAPMPCSLGLELSNVLCVASAPAQAASAQPLATDIAPTEFFADLIYDLSSDATPPAANSNDSSDSSSSSGNATDSSSANSTDSAASSGNGNVTGHYSNAPDADDSAAPDQEANTITSVGGAGVSPEAGVARTLLLAPSPVALLAPGRNIMGGWAWGGHAAVSGGSAAAAVAAGAAALTWSNLGQVLGAEASGAAALEGLGQVVKQVLVESSSSDAANSAQSRVSRSSSGDRASSVVRSPGDAVNSGSSSSRGSGPGAGRPSLNLLQAQQLSSAYTGVLLQCSVLLG
jgi:hypothetical protein